MTNEELMNNYERAAVYIATCLTNMESAVVVRARQVSELSTRQYSQEEWNKLSKDEKDSIIRKRQEKGHSGLRHLNSGRGGGSRSGGRFIRGGRGRREGRGGRGGRSGRHNQGEDYQPRTRINAPPGGILRRNISQLSSDMERHYEPVTEVDEDEECEYDASDAIDG